MNKWSKKGGGRPRRRWRRSRPPQWSCGPLVLADSVPPDGAAGVNPNIREVRMVFKREKRSHIRAGDCGAARLLPGRRVIETIDMWRGFKPVKVTVTRGSPAQSVQWPELWRPGHRGKWNRDWCREAGLVYLVKPVSKLRARTKYKVRVKYLEVGGDSCGKRRSAQMIVFTTGRR